VIYFTVDIGLEFKSLEEGLFFAMIMKKIRKGLHIVLIFTLVGVFLSTEVVHALRVPMGLKRRPFSTALSISSDTELIELFEESSQYWVVEDPQTGKVLKIERTYEETKYILDAWVEPRVFLGDVKNWNGLLKYLDQLKSISITYGLEGKIEEIQKAVDRGEELVWKSKLVLILNTIIEDVFFYEKFKDEYSLSLIPEDILSNGYLEAEGFFNAMFENDKSAKERIRWFNLDALKALLESSTNEDRIITKTYKDRWIWPEAERIKAAKNIHKNKQKGFKVYRRLSLEGSTALLETSIEDLAGIDSVRIKGRDGNIREINISGRKIYSQEKVEMLGDLLHRLYEEGKKELIKTILLQVIDKTEKQLWGFRTFDQNLVFTVNWGAEVNKQGYDVRVLDFGELTNDKNEAIRYLKSHQELNEVEEITDINKWISIARLTDTEIASWFAQELKKIYTVDNFKKQWKNAKKTPSIFSRIGYLKSFISYLKRFRNSL